VALISTGWLFGGTAGAQTAAPTAGGTNTIYPAAGLGNNKPGSGKCGFTGDGGPAGDALLCAPTGVSEDMTGNTYWGDTGNNRVRKATSSTTGKISTVAGNGTSGYSGDGSPATTAKLSSPSGTAISNGNLYIADTGNNVIRKVNSAGIISTVAGNTQCDMNNNGVNTHVHDNGPATQAELCAPTGIALDSAGNLYIADTGDNRIRKVNTSGIITTIAGTGQYGYNGDNKPATQAQLFFPTGVALDGINEVFIADTVNSRVRVINIAGIIHTFAGTGQFGYNGDGIIATTAKLSGPTGLGIDGSGSVFISDTFNNRIRKVDLSSKISTYAGTGASGNTGDGGDATKATLNSPTGAVATDNVHVYISDTGNNRGRAITGGPPPVIAEINYILLLPISALLLGGAAYLVMMRRRRSTASAAVPAV
jgi:sugar lactone lactonase YvrE